MATSLTGIIAYGVGNVRSVFSAVKAVGGEPILTASVDELLGCDRLILPGVGAFSSGMAELEARGLDMVVKTAAESGVPIMGICLGMQMLAQKSLEFGETKGLGLVDDVVSLLQPSNPDQMLRLPHVAWKPLTHNCDEASWLFHGVDPAANFYFIHSYAMTAGSAHVAATAEHGGAEFGAVLLAGNVVGTQFHPEKSGSEGLKLLNNFVSKG